MKYSRILAITRPRFWLYVLGTYLVGVAAAGSVVLHDTTTIFLLIALFLFFTFPANVLIYGINDIFDYETDKHNPKKQGYEELVTPADRPPLVRAILWSCLPFLVLIIWLPASSIIALAIFIFTGIFYSAPPLRAKVRPFLDILFSSTIYISPGVAAFLATGHTDIAWLAVLAGLLWASAMQSFSAVPDIEADQQADMTTLATVFGANGTVLLCLFAFAGAAMLGYHFIGLPAVAFGCIYVGMMTWALMAPRDTFAVYKLFPTINTLVGFSLFVVLVLQLN